jgi:hypothetical protein
MRVHARQLATGHALEVNDWHRHIIAIEHEHAVTVPTAEVGWIQGLPKKLGAVHVTRAVELPGAVSTPTQAGGTFVATCIEKLLGQSHTAARNADLRRETGAR